MRHPFDVRAAHGLSQRNRHVEETIQIETTFRDVLGEGLALHKLHRDEMDPVGLFDGMDGDDVGVLERGHGLGLALEALAALGVASELLGQHLERHVAVEPGVAGAVHLAHATLAELLDDLVMGKIPADHAGIITVYPRHVKA